LRERCALMSDSSMSRTHRLTEEVETPSSAAIVFTPAPCLRRSRAAFCSRAFMRTHVRMRAGRHDIDWSRAPMV
jgi:hypothetical protein